MSIDYLLDLERAVLNGQKIFAAAAPGKNQWLVSTKIDDTRKTAQRTADANKSPAQLYRLTVAEEVTGDGILLVPTKIGEEGRNGDPQISWTPVGSKDIAETMRDVSQGPAPYFGLQLEETLAPGQK